jgi:hypothetical protein
MKKAAIFLISILVSISIMAQVHNPELLKMVNTLSPAVPFLNIPVFASTQASGYITSVKTNNFYGGQTTNPSIISQSENKFSASVSHIPWIKELLPNLSLSGISVSGELRPNHFLSADLVYFDLGSYTMIGQTGKRNPSEILGSLAYSFSHESSNFGIRVKYIWSDLVGYPIIGGMPSEPGKSVAIDLGYSHDFEGNIPWLNQQIGFSINNLGTKISYQKNSVKSFLPTTLIAGYASLINLSQNQTIILAYEAEKLLIPTPPFYYPDSTDSNGDQVIQYGYPSEISVTKALIRSFYDAPGGAKEELNEIVHHFAIHYQLKNFNVESGLVLESNTKGNRKFATIGLGYAYRNLSLQISYIVPFFQNNEYARTLGMSLAVNL